MTNEEQTDTEAALIREAVERDPLPVILQLIQQNKELQKELAALRENSLSFGSVVWIVMIAFIVGFAVAGIGFIIGATP